MAIQEGTITATGETDLGTLASTFNLSLGSFGTASINLERSFDGVKWGVLETFTANAEKTGESNERAQYRFNTTAYTSGTITYRVS